MAETAAEPVKVTLGDGSVVQGANMEEAFKNLAKMKEDTAQALKEAREQAKQFQEQQVSLAREVEALKKPKQTNGNGFDKDRYFEMLNSDPVSAQDYLDGHRFGLAPEQVRPTFIGMKQQVDVITQQSVGAAFLAQHAEDFPSQDKAAVSALTRRAEQLVASGMPFNIRTLNYAYGELVDEGTVKPIEPKKEKQEEIEPNPALHGGGSTGMISQAEEEKLANISTADLEKYMRSKGVLK